jgi:hypothetical protein
MELSKEFANDIATHYGMAINKIKGLENFSEVRKIICEMNVENGICSCCVMQFNRNITGCSWIKEMCGDEIYMFQIPWFSWSVDGILECLNFRYQKLLEYANS